MKDKSDISKEELKNSYHIQRKIFEMEEKHLLEKHLFFATQRVLDIRDARNIILTIDNNERQKNERATQRIEKQYGNDCIVL